MPLSWTEFPIPLLGALFALLIAWNVILWRREWRARVHCPYCGGPLDRWKCCPRHCERRAR